MIGPKIKSYLDRLAKSGSRPNSYIFSGMDSEAKEEAALYFISKIAEKSGDEDFLAIIKAKNHPDVVMIEPEIEEKKGKTREKEISISQVREALERIKFFPYELKTKFCVIRKSQKMNVEAANAILKNLEEPSKSAIFLLLADNPESLLPTIISRCAILRFPQIRLPEWCEDNRKKLKNIFKEEIFERFEYIEKISKNKNEMISVLRDWELVMAESLRKLVGSGDDSRKVEKVTKLIENTREAINRFERTNANARGAGEKLMLDLG